MYKLRKHKGITKKETNQLVKNELLKELGLTKEFLEQIHKDGAVNYVKEVKEAVTKVKGKVRIGAGRYSWMGKLENQVQE